MESLLKSYLERLENLRQGFHQAVADLPPEAMDWVPGPEMNSAAVLLAHTSGSLRFWIGDAALGEPSMRDRGSEFRTNGLSGQEMLRRLDEVMAYARTALHNLSPEDLEQKAFIPWNKQPVTRGWALLHALEHGYLHLGHIEITRQMWKANQ